ncbi:drebrin-like protein B isoform X1 [Tachysurus ichikawai]
MVIGLQGIRLELAQVQARALFAYDGFTNNLKLFDSGNGGLTELAQKFHIAKPMYGLCRIALPGVEQSRIILICWGFDPRRFVTEGAQIHLHARKACWDPSQ